MLTTEEQGVSMFRAIVHFILFLAVSNSAIGEIATLHVSPRGNDAWSGALSEPNADNTDGPLATVQRARDRIRELKQAGQFTLPVTVEIHEGVYRIGAPIEFTPEDSGTFDKPVRYVGKGKATISGGIAITEWQLEDGKWVADISDIPPFGALWVNGEPATPARSPNEGYFTTAGKAPELIGADGKPVDRTHNAFAYTPGDLANWDDAKDGILVLLHSWDVSYHHIASLDEANHVVNLTATTSWPIENWGPKQRYFMQGVAAALEAPGEWYRNSTTKKLYYVPRAGETIDTVEAIAPVVQQLIVLNGDMANGKHVEYMQFDGLTFSHTEWPLPAEGLKDYQAAFPVNAAFEAQAARYCSLSNSEVSHIGNYAIWFRAGCKDNRIVRNHCYDLGAGGVRIAEGNSPANDNEAAFRNVIDNNWLHDGGKIFPAAVGVWIGRSSYNTVSHNEISDFYYTGVSVGWSWGYDSSSANHNIIEYNHIHHLGKYILSDMGGIYTLGVAPGTILRYNHIHDVHSFYYGGWGIYPDEGSTDLLIENNIAYNTKTGGFHQHYGKENRVQNNIFAFSQNDQIMRTREEDHLSFYFERNIVYFNSGSLLGSNWKNGHYVIDNNCYWDTRSKEIAFKEHSFGEWRALGRDVRSIVADPLFENAEAGDFRLKDNSPALALGFSPIDATKSGLYGDSAWVDGPKNMNK
jgi:parallel beta-helix repeat protein